MDRPSVRKYTIRELQQVRQAYRNVFLRGLLVVLPLALCAALLLYVYSFVETRVGVPLNGVAKQLLVETEVGQYLAVEWLGVDAEFLDQSGAALARQVDLRYPTWLGIALAALFVFLLGAFLTSFLGREVWPRVEAGLGRLPLIRGIYPYAKQVGQFIFHQEQIKGFRGVVAFPWPRPGIWSLGLVTSGGIAEINEKVNTDCVAVMVPYGCGPYAWVAQVAVNDVIPVDMTAEEAFRFFLTNGLVTPERPERADTPPQPDRTSP